MVTVEQFFATLSPEIKEIATRARGLVQSVLPACKQEWLDSANRLLYYGSKETKAGNICYVKPLKHSVHLVFVDGDKLPDPMHLLRGTEKKLRFIKLEASEQLDHPAVRGLLEAAFERATIAEALLEAMSASFGKGGFQNVTVEAIHYRGVEPCPDCGKSVPMSLYTVRHIDRRSVVFWAMAWHHLEAGHSIDDIPVNVLALVAIMSDAQGMDEKQSVAEPDELEESAIYLGVLTARKIKPLSRLEYSIRPDVLGFLENLGLTIDSVTRVTQEQTKVKHLILGTSPDLIEQYKTEFDGRRIQDGIPSTIRSEARYFGYPECCAEAYIKAPNAPTDLIDEEQLMLFHRPCHGCRATARMIPLYKSILKEARQLHKELLLSRQSSNSHAGRKEHQIRG